MNDVSRPTFPFSALLGQEALQRALLLLAIDPKIGGVLIDGPRGTAKSTSARAMADLLPGGPFVTLPLGATEEMLIGTLNIEAALRGGAVQFAPGLLAKAHGGVLYVDEVNLLPDVLVDQLLDVAASGINVIERDGISHWHAASFALIGTMNPEEGELRPQLLDRFGLALTLESIVEPRLRRDIVKARMAFDADPRGFCERYAAEQEKLKQHIVRARSALTHLQIDDAVHDRVCALCVAAQVEGMRADLVMVRAARALAALQAHEAVSSDHVDAVAELALHHRRRGSPNRALHPESNGRGESKGDRERSDVRSRALGEGDRTSHADSSRSNADTGKGAGTAAGASTSTGASVSGDVSAGAGASASASASASGGVSAGASVGAVSSASAGEYGALPPQPTEPLPARSINIPAQKKSLSADRGVDNVRVGARRREPQSPVSGLDGTRRIHWVRTLAAKADRALERGHLRFRPLSAGAGTLHCLLVDCSGSMLAGRQLARAKGVLLQLMQMAYEQRAQVAMIGFAGADARIFLAPTLARPSTSRCVEKWLQPIRAGGGTPFARGAAAASAILMRAARSRPAQSRWLWLLTDGRSSESPARPAYADVAVMIDCEQSRMRLSRCQAIAARWKAHYRALADFTFVPHSEPGS